MTTNKDDEAIQWLANRGGSVLVSAIPDRDDPGVIGDWTPGMARFKRLQTRQLVYITEEDPLDLGDGELFEFTPSVELSLENPSD